MPHTPMDDLTNPLSLINLSEENSENEGSFEVNLDVLQFNSEEVSLKIVNDTCLVVEAQHEEEEDDYGLIMRHYTRRFELSDNLDLEKIQCNISSDGIMNITVPKKERIERVIAITETNEPFINPNFRRPVDDLKHPDVLSPAA